MLNVLGGVFSLESRAMDESILSVTDFILNNQHLDIKPFR